MNLSVRDYIITEHSLCLVFVLYESVQQTLLQGTRKMQI